ncbi:MAG TPA: hypothetical protein PLP30_02575 [Clostridia bacterium]|nr:hypothetical protein [Clostridia bacterium]HRX42793.1 hypothetical protein [Clostridia bacterium]
MSKKNIIKIIRNKQIVFVYGGNINFSKRNLAAAWEKLMKAHLAVKASG